MTTTVTVQAHCADDTEVFIVTDRRTADPIWDVIQNGDMWSGYVYDERSIIVYERKKSPAPK